MAEGTQMSVIKYTLASGLAYYIYNEVDRHSPSFNITGGNNNLCWFESIITQTGFFPRPEKLDPVSPSVVKNASLS